MQTQDTCALVIVLFLTFIDKKDKSGDFSMDATVDPLGLIILVSSLVVSQVAGLIIFIWPHKFVKIIMLIFAKIKDTFFDRESIIPLVDPYGSISIYFYRIIGFILFSVSCGALLLVFRLLQMAK